VRTVVDARLRDEAARFQFRFACDDCGHFDEERQQCSLSYPAAPRRRTLELVSASDGGSAGVELCKTFELG
jgi:hypothetical protein